jgi:Ni/Co efflux regulator RcnB
MPAGRRRRPPRPAPLAPGGRVHWSRDHAAWRTTASQQSGLYHWTYVPGAHAWTRGEKVSAMGATRE